MDGDTGQTIISGMGELHLDIYIERMRREYKVLDSPLHVVTSGCQGLSCMGRALCVTP